MAKNTTTALELDNPFWRFALQIWPQPGIEPCCLALQAQGLSINRLLFCLWLGQTGRQLPHDYHTADLWQQQISHPLRALRFQARVLKQAEPELGSAYQALRKAELACEQVEIAQLYRCSLTATTASAGPALSTHNIQHWLAQQQRPELWQDVNLQQLLRLTAQSPAPEHSQPGTDN